VPLLKRVLSKFWQPCVQGLVTQNAAIECSEPRQRLAHFQTESE